MASLCLLSLCFMRTTPFGDHLVLVTTARWRTHACCKITVSQPWRKYSCVAFFEAAGATFCDNATAWTALYLQLSFKYFAILCGTQNLFPKVSQFQTTLVLTLPMLRILCSKVLKDANTFKNHLKLIMLVFIG